MTIRKKRKSIKRKISKKKSIKKNKKSKKVAISQVIPTLISETDLEVSKPSAWFRAVVKEENVYPTHVWHVNKEKIYEQYGKKFWQYWDQEGNVKYDNKPPGPNVYGYRSAREVVVLPNGNIITPIRQFCETKVLPQGVREAFFYDFGPVSYTHLEEGTEPAVQSPIIRATGTETIPKGTRIDVGYQQTEDSPIDIIASANRSFALESIKDENREVLQTFNDDSGTNGSATTRKAKGGGTKVGRWLDNKGNQIIDDFDIFEISPKNKLTIRALLKAKKVIEDKGLDTSNLVFYTTFNAIQDLKTDPEVLDSGLAKLEGISDERLERILGMKIVKSSACPSTSALPTVKVPVKEKYWSRFKRVLMFRPQPYKDVKVHNNGKRSVLFIPNITFGLVTAENLTMEAQRRHETQCISLTGTQRTSAVVKNIEGAVRISHA